MIHYYKQNVPEYHNVMDSLEHLMDINGIAYDVHSTDKESYLVVGDKILTYKEALSWAERFRD